MPGGEYRGGREPPWRAVLGTATVLMLALVGYPYGGPEISNAPIALEGPIGECPQASVPPEGVLWAGCEEVELSLTGEPTACTLYSDTRRDRAIFRVWLPSRVSEPAVKLDGVAVTADTMPVDDGWSLLVQPSHSGRLVVSGSVEGLPIELLSLEIDYRPRPDKELRARLDGAVGDEEAQGILARELRDELEQDILPPRRLLLTRYLYYLLYDQGDHREAAALAVEAARLAKQHGEVLAECESAWSASFLYGEELADKHEAAKILQDMCRGHDSLSIVELNDSYYRGLLAIGEGRFFRAQVLLQRGAQIARRLRWPRWELDVLNPLAEALANQGRFGWARQALERLRELDASGPHTGAMGPCETETRYHRKLGALAVREAELLGTPLEPARGHWLKARAIILDRSRCPEHASVRDQAERVDVDLARVAVDAGELAQAEAWLDAIPQKTVAAVTDVRRRLGRAELALARGDSKAAARILEDCAADRRRGKLGDAIGPEEDWRLQLAWAQVHQARGKLSAALGALAEAQAHIDRSRGTSGVETDRQAAMRRKSSELLVRLLLEHRLDRQALCSARVARARGLASLGPLPEQTRGSLQVLERSRAALFEGYKWYDPRDIPIDQRQRLDAERHAFEATLSARPAPVECDQLPAGSPGEASVLYFHDGEGFIGFAWSADGRVVVQRVSQWPSKDPPDSLGEVLIAPFAGVLEGATRLRVLAPAAMSEVAFADLVWRESPLGDRLAVAHALDLPVVPLQDRRDQSAALVFSDSSKELMLSYETLGDRFDQWRKGLDAKALHVTFMEAPSAAPEHVSVADVLQGTRGVELALLFGFGAVQPSYYDLLPTHAERPEPDQDGFGVGADVLTRSDILLEAGMVPRHVILAHCDSATVDAHGVSGAIGLAQSYVQAGSEWAVGAVGDVSPESMEVVVDELLAALGRGSSADDVAEALQHAKRRLAEQGLPDAAQLRLWVH